MKMRIVLLLTVVALMVMMLAMSVAPALAGKGGLPTSGSCGAGKAGVQGDIATTCAPGASESGHADFNGCQGHG